MKYWIKPIGSSDLLSWILLFNSSICSTLKIQATHSQWLRGVQKKLATLPQSEMNFVLFERIKLKLVSSWNGYFVSESTLSKSLMLLMFCLWEIWLKTNIFWRKIVYYLLLFIIIFTAFSWRVRKLCILKLCLMAPHSSTLAWKIPWTEEPGGLQSMGLLRVGHDWATSLSLFTFFHWRRKWQPTPVFLPGESQEQGSLVGCRLWGRTELDTTEVT